MVVRYAKGEAMDKTIGGRPGSSRASPATDATRRPPVPERIGGRSPIGPGIGLQRRFERIAAQPEIGEVLRFHRGGQSGLSARFNLAFPARPGMEYRGRHRRPQPGRAPVLATQWPAQAHAAQVDHRLSYGAAADPPDLHPGGLSGGLRGLHATLNKGMNSLRRLRELRVPLRPRYVLAGRLPVLPVRHHCGDLQGDHRLRGRPLRP